MPKKRTEADQSIVLFDGHCYFCSGVVRFIMSRDPNQRFRFAPLQSETARSLLSRHQLAGETETIVVIEDGVTYARSTAALRIARRLSGLWPLLYLFILVPGRLRDLLYNTFARRRYRWFGRAERCLAPTAEMRNRSLE